MPALRHHDDVPAESVGDPVCLGARIGEVGVLLAHHDQGRSGHVGEALLGGGVARAGGEGERLGVARPVQAGDDAAPVVVEVHRVPAGVELRQVRLPREGDPRSSHGDAKQDALDGADLSVADERAHEHEAEHQIGPLSRNEGSRAGSHRVAHDDRRAAEVLDEGDDVARSVGVAVGGEGGVAVAVTAKVGAGDGVTRRPQGRSNEAIGAA